MEQNRSVGGVSSGEWRVKGDPARGGRLGGSYSHPRRQGGGRGLEMLRHGAV